MNIDNGFDYRGENIELSREHWIDEWNGTDSLRFDISYEDNEGNEYFDHYYYDSDTGFSNKAASKQLAGDYDYFLTSQVISTGKGFTFQIDSQYSRIDLSDEK